MEKLTDKQKKIAVIVVAVLLAIHFAPGFINNLRHAFAGPPPAVVQKPSPAQVAPPPPPPPSPEMVAAGKYSGIWIGNSLMPDSQMRCNIRLEIRLSDDLPKKLKGYEQESCAPLQPFAGGKLRKGSIADILRDSAPTSAVMTGTVQEGGITFTVDQTIGTPGDGCALVGMTLTDFGLGQAQVQWQSHSSPTTPCPDNRMLLRKARG
jgi:hypothetical protein